MRFRSDNKFQGKKVSTLWDIVLTDIAKRVKFRLNSGRRTRTEQEALVRQKGLWTPRNPTGAARYSPSAPHIREGRQDHAIDVDTNYGEGEAAVQRDLERQGALVKNPIKQEPWHMEVSESDLRRMAIAILNKKEQPTLRKGVVDREGTEMLQRFLRALGYMSVGVNGKYDLATRVAVRRFQRKYKIPHDKLTTVGPKTWSKIRERIQR